jgi:hypothetical protein
MNNLQLERAATLAVLVFAGGVLITTPWPSVDQLLGIDSSGVTRDKTCLALAKPLPDCPETHAARPQP